MTTQLALPLAGSSESPAHRTARLPVSTPPDDSGGPAMRRLLASLNEQAAAGWKFERAGGGVKLGADGFRSRVNRGEPS